MSREFSLAPLRSLAERLGPLKQLSPMTGGASLRRFYRLQWKDGNAGVGMFFPDAQTAGCARLPEPPEVWPFLLMQQLLAQHGFRVPELLAQDCEAGWVLVEDFGEATVAEVLENAADSLSGSQLETLRLRIYQQAVADLARAQQIFDALPPPQLYRQRSLDAAFLYEELHHFREFGLEARGIHLDAQWSHEFDQLARELSGRIGEQKYGFSHRDYQSRNLMVLNREWPKLGEPGAEASQPLELGWIDFQDATLGPYVYDLVALLRDSYQTFDETFVEARLREFAKHRGLPEQRFYALYEDFDLLTIQRKLKDAGRFVFIERTKGDSSYLPYVEPSLEMARAAMRRRQTVPVVARLSRLLDSIGLR